MNDVLNKKGTFGHRCMHTEECHMNMRIAIYKPRREAWTISFPHIEGGKEPTVLTPWSWNFSLQNCRTTNFCCLSYRVCGTMLQQTWQTSMLSRMFSFSYTCHMRSVRKARWLWLQNSLGSDHCHYLRSFQPSPGHHHLLPALLCWPPNGSLCFHFCLLQVYSQLSM